jgi:hypothetical protein
MQPEEIEQPEKQKKSSFNRSHANANRTARAVVVP